MKKTYKIIKTLLYIPLYLAFFLVVILTVIYKKNIKTKTLKKIFSLD